MQYTIDIDTVPHRTVAVTEFHVAATELDTIGERMSAAFGAVAGQLGRVGVTPGGPGIACYARGDDGFDVSAGFPVAEDFQPTNGVRRLDLGECEVAHTTHLGSYDTLPEAYDALFAGAREQGRRLTDDEPMWEEYWSPPGTPPDRTRTEVFWPVARG